MSKRIHALRSAQLLSYRLGTAGGGTFNGCQRYAGYKGSSLMFLSVLRLRWFMQA